MAVPEEVLLSVATPSNRARDGFILATCVTLLVSAGSAGSCDFSRIRQGKNK